MVHLKLQTILLKQKGIVTHYVIYVSLGNTKYWMDQSSSSEMKKKYLLEKIAKLAITISYLCLKNINQIFQLGFSLLSLYIPCIYITAEIIYSFSTSFVIFQKVPGRTNLTNRIINPEKALIQR